MTFKTKMICEDEPSEEDQERISEIIRESVESIRSNWTPHIRYQRSLGKDSCTDIGMYLQKSNTEIKCLMTSLTLNYFNYLETYI